MPMRRSDFAKDLEDGLNAHFGMTYRQLPEEWSQVFDTDTSNRAFEEEVLEYGFGAAPVKEEGSLVAEDKGGQGWVARYEHETIALSFSITEEAIEDNLYSRQAPKYAAALARALKHTKEIKAANVLNRATNGAYTGGDGKSLLATDHPLAAGGVFSNRLSTLADLHETSIEDLLIMIRKTVDDRNVPIALTAKRLVIPPELEWVARRLLMSPNRPGTADNDINAIKSAGVFSTDPAVITRLTDPARWFIKTDAPNGLKLVKRTGIKRGMQEDFGTGNMRYKARERYSVGFTDPRGIYGG